ncbi:hypothetical protein HNR42_000462 [Deinobacterium chartae]|uniref:DUF402 domain-containing protein n=1 Tax=Deinobacterium chartae TaxID=521158 RepID=A0A841HYM9_9DEIO|nr:DUF402 domain-containing protein [Deinobacterium chartae]MBB6097048.1 hypothetical protein [Deinobacterium chartae]
MHAIKTERHETSAYRHHTNTGVRRVEEYRVHNAGLFVARPFEDHPNIRYWQAHLLPEQGLVVCRYTPHEGRWWCDYYIDIARIHREGDTWAVRDLYLDVAVFEGRAAQILDTDEFRAACCGGLLPPEEAMWAVETAHGLINGLACHSYRLEAWLAERGLHLSWRDIPTPVGA